MSPISTRSAALALTVVASLGLGGCGALSGGTSISQDDLVTAVSDKLTGPQASKAKVSCAGDLTGEKGATQDCLVDLDGGVTGLRLTVTKVDGSDVSYDTTLFLRGDDVASSIGDDLAKQGFKADGVSCAGNLEGSKGKTLDCTVAGPKGDIAVTATTTGTKGLTVNFDYAEAKA